MNTGTKVYKGVIAILVVAIAIVGVLLLVKTFAPVSGDATAVSADASQAEVEKLAREIEASGIDGSKGIEITLGDENNDTTYRGLDDSDDVGTGEGDGAGSDE